MTAINTPGEKAPESQTAQQAPQESGTSLPPAAYTRAEWQNFLRTEELDQLKKIQTEQNEKKQKADELKTKATAEKTKENWTGNSAEKPTMLGMDITGEAKAQISKEVDTELASKMSLFSEVGLNSPENISAIKNVAKEIIFEHFTKTGAKQAFTEKYVKAELVPKLEETFEALKALYEKNKSLFSSPLQFMETFGNYCGLEIISQGRVNEPNIKLLLLTQRSGLQNLVNGFREYLPLNADIARLEKEATALLDTGRQRSGGTTPAPAPTAGPSTAPVATPSTVPASYESAPTAPATTPAETPTPSPAAPGTTPPEGQPDQTPPETETASAEQEINTGNPVMDKIMNAIKSMLPEGLFETIMSWLGMSPEAAAEFASLTEPEKKEALILKEACSQLKLNAKVMTILYKNSEQVKTILANKNSIINISWTEYLQQRLSPQELELLQKDPGMDTQTAEKIAAMILSPATITPSGQIV